MIRLPLRSRSAPLRVESRRRRFGLDTPLPSDPAVIERAVLRHLAEAHPTVLVLSLAAAQGGEAPLDLHAGAPDLLLLWPGGRLACLKIKTQAQRLTDAQQAFADLCRQQRTPFWVVRSLAEARARLARFAADPGSPTYGQA